MFNLNISGFQTKEQANAFISWYEGQGEQDAAPWFENMMEDGDLDVDFMPVDMSVKPTWKADTLHAKLKIKKS